jgi:RNA polymerase sigma-70 factor, ECF subfamily
VDREAEFRRLYDAHRGAVHAYFTGRTGDRELAADLMQDVFTRVWRHLDRLDGIPDERQRAWIFTVARNLSIDSLRQRRTRSATQDSLARERTFPSDPASSGVIDGERAAVVAAAVRRLPEAQRVALAMAAAGGMTSADIGAVLGIPAGTVRYRLSLARQRLADELRRYDQAEEDADVTAR